MAFTMRRWRGAVRLIGIPADSGQLVIRAALDANPYPPGSNAAVDPRRDVAASWIIEPKVERQTRRGR
jgi:hypothetical protein